jgi:hypothetical protein
MAQEVQHLLCKCEDFNSNSSPGTKKETFFFFWPMYVLVVKFEVYNIYPISDLYMLFPLS